MTAPPSPTPAPHEGPEDPRFTLGLLLDVSGVLVAHGYPEPHGVELVDLGMALLRYLNGRSNDNASDRGSSRPIPSVAPPPTTPHSSRRGGRS